MDIFEALFTRRSIRKFTSEDVSDADLEIMLRAAMVAPSGHNSQPWHFVVVRDKALLASIASSHPHAKMAVEAPLAIVVCANPAEAKEPRYWQQDCTAALENMLLAARGKNIGTVWCGLYPLEERVEPVRQLLKIPADINILALGIAGHPAQPFVEADRYRADKVHHDGW